MKMYQGLLSVYPAPLVSNRILVYPGGLIFVDFGGFETGQKLANGRKCQEAVLRI